jgi:L-malate glycosyltransferase
MRVLIVPSWYPTKANPVSGIFFKEQAEALSRHGLDVRVLAPQNERRTSRARFGPTAIHVTTDGGVLTYTSSISTLIPRNPWTNFWVFKRALTQLAKRAVEDGKWRPDLVHLHSAFWGLPGAVSIARRYQVPLVLTEHSTVYFGNSAIERMMLSFPLVRYILNRGFRRVAHTIAVSPALMAAMNRCVAVGSSSVIPNMVCDPDVDRRISQDNDRPFRFFCLGGLVHQKGLDVLLAAVSLMKARGVCRFQVRIGGDGPLRDALLASVESSSLQDTVQLVGRLNRREVARSMTEMDCFVLPSRSETFGVVYAEALLQGKPVIATRCGGPESIVTERNGMLVDVEDADQLADAMTSMLDMCSRFDSSSIRQDALARFGEQAVVARLVEIYEQVLRRSRKEAAACAE